MRYLLAVAAILGVAAVLMFSGIAAQAQVEPYSKSERELIARTERDCQLLKPIMRARVAIMNANGHVDPMPPDVAPIWFMISYCGEHYLVPPYPEVLDGAEIVIRHFSTLPSVALSMINPKPVTPSPPPLNRR
jgi:hypothetical protein